VIVLKNENISREKVENRTYLHQYVQINIYQERRISTGEVGTEECASLY